MNRIPALLAAAVLLAGCGKGSTPGGPVRPWADFVRDLADLDRYARLDTVGSEWNTSYDRTGGNDDFNQFIAPGTEPGWFVIADLEGPGVVRRFWTTGMTHGHRYRFYFDGEKKPRIDEPVEQLFGGAAPWIVPLARNLNYCWHSYVPLTYQKRLRIEVQAPPREASGHPKKLYHQINYEKLPAGQPVETYPRSFNAAQLAVVQDVAAAWSASVLPPAPPAQRSEAVEIAPHTAATLWSADGEGSLREWWISVAPAAPAEWSQVEKEWMQQDVLLRVYYDGLAAPGICSPIGDFFLSGWRAREVNALPLGGAEHGRVFRMPMPYRKGMRIELLNQADRPIAASFSALRTGPRHEQDGYLHAVWTRSGPQPGVPHTFLHVQGRGKYVGTWLGVTGLGQDWWILEGDEMFFIDGETRPSRHGTGLEDYFNGGWYYRGSAFAPLSGILDRAPFRTGQYRFHGPDPVHFDRALLFSIERGDRNVTPGFFRSVAWFYLDAPQGVPCTAAREERRAEEHAYFRPTFMLQLFELERLNNFRAAQNLTREYLERFPGQTEDGVLRLRILEYARLLGDPVTDADYDPFLDGVHGEAAAGQAKLLRWFYEQPNRALVGLNANGPATLYLNGRTVLQGDHPYQLFVAGIELEPGAHLLAADANVVRPEPWVKFGVRTHTGFAGSGLETLSSQIDGPDWNQPGGTLPGGAPTIPSNLVRGTPDAPMLGGVPDAFVLLSSKAYAIRAPEWGYGFQGRARFRHPFTAPVQGNPAWSVHVTGLPE